MRRDDFHSKLKLRADWRLGLVGLTLLLGVQDGRGDDYLGGTPNLFMPRVLNQPLVPGEDSAPPRPHRVRMLGITPGFLSDPVGLDQDDFNPGNPGTPLSTPSAIVPDINSDWATLAVGNDNPFLEPRRQGDPGGVGYYRLATQLQVIDSQTTGCTVGLQGFTPAGLQNAGMPNGPTTVLPTLGFFHLLASEGVALQGFVGNKLSLDNRLDGQFREHFRYGMALQQPVWNDPTPEGGTTYLFLQAQGRYRDPLPGTSTPAALWQFLPGLSWRGRDNLWMSSGVVLPIGPARDIQPGHLQISCSLQF